MKTLTLALFALAQQSAYDKALDAIIAKSEKAETGPSKVEIGDDLIKLLPKFPKERQDLLDTASVWYGKAWPDLDAVWKAKLRVRLDRLYVPLAPGKVGGLPEGWSGSTAEKAKAEVSPVKVRSGGSAAKLTPGKVYQSVLKAPVIQIPVGKDLEVSAWVLTDGTEGLSDGIVVHVSDAEKPVTSITLAFKTDVPIWSRVSRKIPVPEGALRASLDVMIGSTKGVVWLDDISIKVDGKELLTGGGFER